MTFRLVVFDVDGTLLSSTGELLESTRAGIDAIRRAAAQPMVASGRSTFGLRHRLRLMGLDDTWFTLMGANGGHVVDGVTDEVLLRRPLDRELLAEMVAIGREVGVPMMVPEHDRVFATTGDSPYIAFELSENDTRLTVTQELASIEVEPLKLMYTAEPSVLAAAAPVIAEALGDRVSLVFSAPFFLEANPPGVSKGSSLELLCAERGLSMGDVMAFGDNGNDVTMIAAAGLGVAMGNAIPEAKAVADVVAASNDGDGIGLVLQQYFG